MRQRLRILLIVIATLVVAMIASCGKKDTQAVNTPVPTPTPKDTVKEPPHPLPDTLRVATLYSPTSYFIYKDSLMGYDYSLAQQLCDDKGMVMKLVVAPNLNDMLQMLDSGTVDLVAYEVPKIAEYKSLAIPCGPETRTWQVLVQPKEGKKLVKDVTGLVGRDVYVEANSKYQMRLQNLNEELGGGIKIHPIDRDTMITEDLIAMVSSGEIPLTIVDSDIAKINKTYYKDLDITLKLSFAQEAAWAVSTNNQWLADSINAWFGEDTHRQIQAELLKKYFELSKEEQREEMAEELDLSKGRISPYDKYFKKYAKEIGYDWRLLAAQGYAESHFDSAAVSWAGARGIMQIMPSVARSYGLEEADYNNPEASIATSAKLIEQLNKSLSKKVSDPGERMKFIVAAYNSGLGHIYDAIALAQKYDLNPEVWDGNVEAALMMKSKPEYYNDPVCKNGYCRGSETKNYVIKVMKYYKQYKEKIKE